MTNGEDGLWKDKNGKMHHHVKVAAIAALAFLGAFLVVQTIASPQSSFQTALFAAIVGGILTLAGAKAVLPRGDS